MRGRDNDLEKQRYKRRRGKTVKGQEWLGVMRGSDRTYEELKEKEVGGAPRGSGRVEEGFAGTEKGMKERKSCRRYER